ncbi:MAG: sialidase family protein [Planctomycetota bacterium]
MSSVISAIVSLALLQQVETPGRVRPAPRPTPFYWSWSELEFVEREDVYAMNPADIAIDILGVRHLVFGARRPGDCSPERYWCGLYHQSSTDGKTWTRPELIPGTDAASSWSDPVVVADETGRVYVAWVGRGIEVCWSDDRGQTFSSPVTVSGNLPTGFDVDMQIDSLGAVHLAWLGIEFDDSGDYWWDVYYAWSTPTYLGWARRDPEFYPGYAVSQDHYAGGAEISLGVGPGQWVTVAWQDWDSNLRLAQARAGDPFPPSLDPGSGRVVRNPWVVSSSDGAVTVFYIRYGPPDYKQRMYSFVAIDGCTFEGPFALTRSNSHATLGRRRCVQPYRPGEIHVIWNGFVGGAGSFWHSISYDYGRSLCSFYQLWDYRDYPPSGDGGLDLLPDGRPALICYIHRYGEALPVR